MENSSRPSSEWTTITWRELRPFKTLAIGSTKFLSKTPIIWFGALAGFVKGPNTLKIVLIASSLRGPIACFIAL